MIYLPTFDCEWTLSPWTGRPHGLSIDPIGVECRLPAEPIKRRLFQRRPEPDPPRYLHVLVHTDLTSPRIRAWAQHQIAQLAVLEQHPQGRGDELNRLTADELDRLTGREWTATSMTVDGEVCAGSVFAVRPDRWAVYLELGPDRVALVGDRIAQDEVALRTASSAEARAVRTLALRV